MRSEGPDTLNRAGREIEREAHRKMLPPTMGEESSMALASRIMFALLGHKHEYRAKRFHAVMMAACFSLALRIRGDKSARLVPRAFGIDKRVFDDASRYVLDRLDLRPAIEKVGWLHSLPDEWSVWEILFDKHGKHPRPDRFEEW